MYFSVSLNEGFSSSCENVLISVLCDIVVDPCIECEVIESDTLSTDWDFSGVWPYFCIELNAVHAKVVGCVPHPQQTLEQFNRALFQ